jgi:hypothetical protein
MLPNKIIIPPTNDKVIADDDKGDRLFVSVFDSITITYPSYSAHFYYLMSRNAM